jgi:hypothetical protein
MDFNRLMAEHNFNPYLDTTKVPINTCFIMEPNSLQLNLAFRNNLIRLDYFKLNFILEFSPNYIHSFDHSSTKAIGYNPIVISILEHYRSKFTKNSSSILQACLEDPKSQ